MDPLSPRNARVQAVRRLARQARERADQRAFVVEGPVLVAEAIGAGLVCDAVFHSAGLSDELLVKARRATSEVVEVSPEAMKAMATTVTPQAVLGVFATPSDASLPSLAGRPGHIVVFDRLQDPGNAGTILRSAEASGAAGVVFGPGSVDSVSPKVVRASAGSRFRVVTCTPAGLTVPEIVAELQRAGRRVCGTAADAELVYDETDLTQAVIVMGNEAAGLGPETAASLDCSLRIPQAGRGESLNVAMAATILCFEAARQRRGTA